MVGGMSIQYTLANVFFFLILFKTKAGTLNFLIISHCFYYFNHPDKDVTLTRTLNKVVQVA